MAFLRGETTGNELGDASIAASAGDLIVVTLRERDGSTMAVSDGTNGSYTRAVAAPVTVVVTEIWYFRNSAAATLAFTVTGGSVRDYNVSVWGGMQDVAVNTTNSVTNSATTSHTHGSVTPSASALIITSHAGATHGGMTPHSGFTALTAGASGAGGTVDRPY
jgi:hypothetical protein